MSIRTQLKRLVLKVTKSYFAKIDLSSPVVPDFTIKFALSDGKS